MIYLLVPSHVISEASERRDGWSPTLSQPLYIYAPRFLHCSLGVIDINTQLYNTLPHI